MCHLIFRRTVILCINANITRYATTLLTPQLKARVMQIHAFLSKWTMAWIGSFSQSMNENTFSPFAMYPRIVIANLRHIRRKTCYYITIRQCLLRMSYNGHERAGKVIFNATLPYASICTYIIQEPIIDVFMYAIRKLIWTYILYKHELGSKFRIINGQLINCIMMVQTYMSDFNTQLRAIVYLLESSWMSSVMAAIWHPKHVIGVFIESMVLEEGIWRGI